MKQTSDQQHARLREMSERMQGLVVELERARAEKEKAEAVAQEAERGTAKGRSFEEAVLRRARRDRGAPGRRLRRGRATSRAATGKTGDVVVAIEGCTGPGPRPRRVRGEGARGCRSRRRSRSSTARAAERQADFAVLVVPDEERIPAKMHQLREYGGDKLVACFDPEEGSALSLEVAYSLARARVLMARGEAEGIDASAIREAIERATGAMGDVLRIKQQMTGAKTSIEQRRGDPRRDGRRRARAAPARGAAAGRGRRRLGRRGGIPFGGHARGGRASGGGSPAEEERLPRAATIAAGQRPRVVREPEPPFPGAQQLPF